MLAERSEYLLSVSTDFAPMEAHGCTLTAASLPPYNALYANIFLEDLTQFRIA